MTAKSKRDIHYMSVHTDLWRKKHILSFYALQDVVSVPKPVESCYHTAGVS